jgi:hypothetical protein
MKPGGFERVLYISDPAPRRDYSGRADRSWTDAHFTYVRSFWFAWCAGAPGELSTHYGGLFLVFGIILIRL